MKNDFEKKVLKKATKVIKESLALYKNEFFTHLEFRLMGITEDFLKLRKAVSSMNKKAKVRIFKVDENIPDLEYKQHGDSGLDIVSTISVTIKQGERTLIPSGIAVSIPNGYEFQLRPKSSMREGTVILGTIDSNYRGEISVDFINNTQNEIKIDKYQKIGQLVLVPVVKVIPEYVTSVEKLGETARGGNGFGSTNNIHWVTVREIDVATDVLLEMKKIVDYGDFGLPVKFEGFLDVVKIKLNLNRIVAKVSLSEGVSYDIEKKHFIKGDEKMKLRMSYSKDSKEYLFNLISIE